MMEEKMMTMMGSIATLVGVALLKLSELLLGAVGVWFAWNYAVVPAFQTSHFTTPPATYTQVLAVWLLVYMVKNADTLRFNTGKKAE